MKNTEKPSTRRIIGMVVGIVIIGLGIALFKQSHLGNDSISALNMRVSELLGVSLGLENVCINILFFLLEIAFGRKYIGLGTFVNGIFMGYIVTAFYDPIAAAFGPAESLPMQLVWLVIAVPVTALGVSLYQTADLGIAPYDYLSLGLRDYTPSHTSAAVCSPMPSVPCSAGSWAAWWALEPSCVPSASGPLSSSSMGLFLSGCCGISRESKRINHTEAPHPLPDGALPRYAPRNKLPLDPRRGIIK